MKLILQKITPIFLLLFGHVMVHAQCTESADTKVLLVGDSWAVFMNVDQTLNNTFTKWGHSDKKYFTNATISENGSETDDFLKANKKAEIINQLTTKPSIKIVHLSIGGNDVLGDWKVSMRPGQVDTLRAGVAARLDTIITYIKAVRPDVRIVWSGYAYPNFGEVINDFPSPTSHPFYNAWQKMELPTFEQINNMLVNFSNDVAAYAANDPRVDFIPAPAILQYTFGQAAPLSIAPGGSYAAFTQPLPNGDPTYPSPKGAMRDYGFFKDCFHLSPKGYADLIDYQTKKLYQKLLMDDKYLLAQNNTQNGSVSSAGNISNDMYIGQDAVESFATVLTFNTTQMADTQLNKASIFLRRESLTGTNPIAKDSLVLKMKKGNFSTSANIEAADFAATADVTETPCFFGSNTGDGDWIRIDLPTSMTQALDNTTPVQFILTSTATGSGKVKFSNGVDPEFAPVLNLDYVAGPNAIKEVKKATNIEVYPNPTRDFLTIIGDISNIQSVKIFNLLGEEVYASNSKETYLDISKLNAGVYIVNVETKEGKATQRVTKF